MCIKEIINIFVKKGIWDSEFTFLEKDNLETVILNITNDDPLSHVNELIFLEYTYEILKTFSFLLKSLNIKNGIILIDEENEKGIKLLNEYEEFFKDIKIKKIKEEYPMFDRNILLKREFSDIEKEISILKSEVLFYCYEALFENIPMTEKFLTVSGEKRKTFFTRVPIGIKVEEVLKNIPIKINMNEKIIINGIMIGYIGDQEVRIDKKMNSILITESDKKIVTSRLKNAYKELKKQCASVCNQCNLCTDFCPKNKNGFDINPQKIINSIITEENLIDLLSVFSCNECNLCSLYICPQNLNPMGLIKILKSEFKEQKIDRFISENSDFERERKLENVSFKITNNHLKIKLGMNNFKGYENKKFTDNTKIYKIKIENYFKISSWEKKQGDNIKKNEILYKFFQEKRDLYCHSPVNGKILEISEKFILIKKE